MTYRMYSMVLYNLSPIQQGIQAGHANTRYGQLFKNDPAYNQWADEDLTHIVLNGGGSSKLNEAFKLLLSNDIKVVPFHEPDLYDQMTAFSFLVDERVWDNKNYPLVSSLIMVNHIYLDPTTEEYLEERNARMLAAYGTDQNVFLKEYLPFFKLA